MKKTFAIVILLLLFVSFPSIRAVAPYKTETVNRFGELVPTQDAYEPYHSLTVFNYGGVKEKLNKPQDIFVDGEGYIYIADTGNKRIVVFDPDWNCVSIFGATELTRPQGLFVRGQKIYVADFGSETDNQSGRIHIYDYDKENGTATYDKALARPDSPVLAVENFIYRPQKIAVDANGTMYIVSQGSSNGVLLVTEANRFLNYFAPNAPAGTFLDLVRDFFYGGRSDVLIEKKIPTAPTNVMLDDSGYIYTVTRTVVRNNLGDAIKRVNIGGVNFFPVDMISAGSFVDCWTSKYGTVYAVTANGYIYEYDIDGNLLFRFSGPIASDEQLGLFRAASAIAVAPDDVLYVVDETAGCVQFFRKTEFTATVHVALKQYTEGRYAESEELWEEVLRYNSLFDLAYKGIGFSKYLAGDYREAMRYFRLANAREEYSEAFWEVRNLWLVRNMGLLMIAFFSGIAVLIALAVLNRKYAFMAKVTEPVKRFTARPAVSNWLVMFKFLRHPLDAVYDVRYNKKIKIYAAIAYLALLFAVYVLHLAGTGFIFNRVVLERTILIREAMKLIIPILLFVFANHLISSLMSGEGTLRSIFINTIGSLGPVIIIMPIAVALSNVLTENENFVYYFLLAAMVIWTVVLLFVVIKETHNYTARQVIVNFILTAMMMAIIVIVALLLYLVFAQVFGFIADLIKEVIYL